MFIDQMNYLEVQDYLKNNDTVILGTGSLENHGKHMPLGTDTFIPTKIIELLDQKIHDEVAILPMLPYGSTEDLLGFPGTVSLGPTLLTEVLNHICDNLYDYGFRHFIIVNGHGGNSKSIEQTGLHLYKKGALLARVDWWLLAGQLNPKWRGGHGGAEEAAGVMAYDESLIKKKWLHEGENYRNDVLDDLPSYSWNSVSFQGGQIVVPRPLTSITDNGWMAYGIEQDVPYNANKKWGDEMVQTMANYISDFTLTFKNAKLPK